MSPSSPGPPTGAWRSTSREHARNRCSPSTVYPNLGATDWGVEVNIKGARAKSVLAIDRLPELRGIRRNGENIELGAASTLSELERDLAGEIPLLGKLFPQFASRLIRNGATIGGNLGT